MKVIIKDAHGDYELTTTYDFDTSNDTDMELFTQLYYGRFPSTCPVCASKIRQPKYKKVLQGEMDRLLEVATTRNTYGGDYASGLYNGVERALKLLEEQEATP